ncbi:MAG: hypothetical protein KDD83_01185, partial [Caldilineaceae bacterium]|nr:hypothetical protein [Caldilineaceae bacterium]
GWGAHPLYHYFATLLGIRPAGLGFDEVEIRPMPGALTHLSGEMVHPRGRLAADLHFADETVRGTVALPPGVQGTFRYAGKSLALQPGAQSVAL